MRTITIPVTLPEDIAEQAKTKGLLTPESVSMLVSEAVKNTYAQPGDDDYPPDFDPRLKGLVDPRQYRNGKILGDIVEPIDVAWEAEA